MDIYNKNKTQILENPDLNLGKLVSDTILVHKDEILSKPPTWHYEVMARYPNGGKDVKYIEDSP